MRFQITSSKFTTNPDKAGWSTAHDFAGNLIVLASSKRETSEIIPGSAILTRIHQDFLNTHEIDTFFKLQVIVTRVFNEFNKEEENLSLLVACFTGDGAIYISGKGGMHSFILRNHNLVQVFSSKEDKVKTVSGFLREGDVILFTTTSFSKVYGLDTLKSLLNIGNATSSIEKFRESLHIRENKGSLAAVVVKIGKEIKEAPQKLQEELTPPVPIVVSPFRRKIANLIDKILMHLPSPEQRIFVKDEFSQVKNTKKRKVAVTVGIALLILLLISIIFGVRENKNNNIRSKYEGRLTNAQHEFEEAKSLASLNQSRARELILNAKSEAQNLVRDGVKDERLTKLLTDIELGVGQIAGIYEGNADLYLDLSLISSGFKADTLASSDGRMVVLDKLGKKLVGIDIATKKTEIAAGPDVMPNATSVAPYSDRNFVLASDGVWEVGDKAQLDIKSEWNGETLIFAYTGNVYVLEKGNSSIWRYQGLGGGSFATKQNWFGVGVKPDLTQVKSWVIDGSIWVLNGEGQILKFAQGSPVAFSLKDVNGQVIISSIYTNEDSKYLYLLDATNGRILVVDKDGNYKAVYLVPEAKGATGMVVSESEKKIILLTNTKLFSVEIRHL